MPEVILNDILAALQDSENSARNLEHDSELATPEVEDLLEKIGF